MKPYCCETCAWALAETGSAGTPFDEAVVHSRFRDMLEGDVVKTMRRLESTGRCELGDVLSVEKVGRRKRVTVKWADQDEPYVRLSEGAAGMLRLKRPGEVRGHELIPMGVTGHVSWAGLPRP